MFPSKGECVVARPWRISNFFNALWIALTGLVNMSGNRDMVRTGMSVYSVKFWDTVFPVRHIKQEFVIRSGPSPLGLCWCEGVVSNPRRCLCVVSSLCLSLTYWCFSLTQDPTLFRALMIWNDFTDRAVVAVGHVLSACTTFDVDLACRVKFAPVMVNEETPL